MGWLEDAEVFELKETITPKRLAQGLTPRQRKWKNTRQARNETMTNGRYGHGNIYRSTWWPHEIRGGISPSGIPWYEWMPHRSRKYNASGGTRHRSGRALRTFNGVQFWGWDRDAWGKPPVQGKSSRVRMRLLDEWWELAYESLTAE